MTFRWHSVQGVYQIPGPGICPPPSGTSSASSTCSLLSSAQPPAAVAPCEELAPLQQGTHSPTGMYIWADPGAGGGVTYWFTSQAGTACEDGEQEGYWGAQLGEQCIAAPWPSQGGGGRGVLCSSYCTSFLEYAHPCALGVSSWI